MPSTLDAVERVALHQQIVEAVLALDEPYRTTVVLRFWEDRPPRDVARLMEVPVSTVRTRIRRALTTLRDRLDHSFGNRSAWSGMLAFGLENAPAVGATTVPAASLVLAGGLLMTTKAKLAAVAVVCGVLLATLWALQEPSGEGGLPHDPAEDPGGGRLVAEGEGGGKMAAAAAKEPSERTEVPRQPVAKPGLGSLLVRAIWADDKKPAAGVMLSTERDDPLFDRRSRIADQNGTLRIENLRPGRMFVRCYRGDYGRKKRVTIEAGKETQVQIVVPVGLNLDGIVVDQGGNPVAGADLMVAPWGGGYATPIAKSGADGRFHLRHIRVNSHVGARALGHAPSPLHQFVASKGSSLKARIVLGGRGGGLHGRVLDPRGQPVPNAVVQVGEEAPRPIKLPDGSYAVPPVPVRVRTDGDGHFVAAGLAPGRFPVAVWAKGLAPWFGTVDVFTDGDNELVVHLLPAATLSGTARDGDGKPIEKVLVRAVSGHNSLFGDRWMRTDADGKYRLEDLGPGKLKIFATSQEGRTETELVVVAGQTLQWNPVLAKGLVLRGRVVDEQDKPAPQVPVSASLENPGKDRWWRDAQTDKEGRFVLKGCLPGKKIRIHVLSRSHTWKNVLVNPDHKDLIIRLQSVGKPSVYITGQVLDSDGKPVKECSVVPRDRRVMGGRMVTTEVGTGRFKLGPCPPGEYSVRIRAKGYPVVRTAFKKLNKNDTWDLGVIRLQHAGFLQVKLKGETSLLPENGWFPLQDAAKETFDYVRIRNGKAERSNQLAPGTYYLQVMDKNYLCARHKFEIQAGEDTHLEVPLKRGTLVVLEFVIKANDKLVAIPRGGVMVEIKDTTGRMILTHAALGVSNSEYLRRLEFAIRPGKYQVTAATTWTGARGEAALTVGDKPADPKRIVLR